MAKTKRLYYGPWRLRRHEPVSCITIKQGPHGDPNIEVESYKEFERTVGPGVPWSEARKEIRDSIPLKYMLEKLKLKDADYNILNLLKGGIDVIFKMATLYQYYLQREEEKQRRPEIRERERKRRALENLRERKYKAQRKAELKRERLKKLKEKKERDAKERKIRLEAKQKAAIELAKHKEAAAALKKFNDEKKAKAREEALQTKQYADSWLNPPGRRIELDA